MPDITARIEQILIDHTYVAGGDEVQAECTSSACLWRGWFLGDWRRHVAEVLTSELLAAEWALTTGGGRQTLMSERAAKDKAARWPESFGVASRYVTAWSDE